MAAVSLDQPAALALMTQGRRIRVRLDPRQGPATRQGHWGHGTLISAHPGHAMVQPDGHKHAEKVEWRFIRLWKSQMGVVHA